MFRYDLNLSYYKIWADPETGVEYIIYNYGGRLVMTPRFNADGSLCVTEK
mgnify:FL=1